MKKRIYTLITISAATFLFAEDLTLKQRYKNTVSKALEQVEIVRDEQEKDALIKQLDAQRAHKKVQKSVQQRKMVATQDEVPQEIQSDEIIDIPQSQKDIESIDNQATHQDAAIQEPTKVNVSAAVQAASGEFIIDSIQAVVFSPHGTQVITRSDVERPSIAGQVRTLDDIVFERLVVLDAMKHKIPMDDDAVDKYLAQIQRENNLTSDQLKEVFASAGYSYAQGREQFKTMQTVNTMLDIKVRSGLIVPRKDIESYYEQNPVFTPARYHIQYVNVPFAADRDTQEEQLMQYAKTGKTNVSVDWSEPFWVEKEDVAANKTFIFDLSIEEISTPEMTLSGFEMYRLKDTQEARKLSLEERYREIANILRQPRAQQLMKEYKDSLINTASVLYL